MKKLTKERVRDMKARIVMIIMAVALIALPTMAQQQEWQSTSAMQTSGSNYTPQVNAVGATTAPSVATTTEIYSPAATPGPNRAKKFDTGGDSEKGPSPIGDAMVPLMLCALAFCGVVYFRRRKALNS
jgi:hypothetical protein